MCDEGAGVFLGETQDTEEQGEGAHTSEGEPTCKREVVGVEGGVHALETLSVGEVHALETLSVGEGAGDTEVEIVVYRYKYENN